MKTLVAGPELSGKSTFLRRYDIRAIKEHLLCTCLDCDKNCKLMPLPSEFQPDMDYLIEDRNGLSKEPFYPISMYDRIYYILPGWLTHLFFWLNAIWLWFQRGTFGHDPDTGVSDGWRGSGDPYDMNNFRPIFKELKKKWKYRRDSILYDMFKIEKSGIPFTVITPKITKRGIVFSFMDENWKIVKI